MTIPKLIEIFHEFSEMQDTYCEYSTFQQKKYLFHSYDKITLIAFILHKCAPNHFTLLHFLQIVAQKSANLQ